MQAIVLAAGEGRRLRPLTAHRPKVMLPVGGRPILEHVVRALVANGVTDITFVTGYNRERIQTYFQDGNDFGASISYAVQRQQLGTGHALATGFDATMPDGPFLVFPGDNYVTPGLVKSLLAAPAEAALVTTQSPEPSKYGVVVTEGDRVTEIQEKPVSPRTRLISTGIYRLTPQIRDHLEDPAGLSLTDAVNQAIAGGLAVTNVMTEDAWQDVVYPWDLLDVNARALAERSGITGEGKIEEGATVQGAAFIDQGSTIRTGSYLIGPVYVGANCDIGPNVVIRGPASIGDHVRIGPFSDLENVVVLDSAVIDTGGIIRHTILDEGVRLGPRVSADRGPTIFTIDEEFQRIDRLGAVVGQDAFIGANTVLEPGAVIGTGASVAANRTVGKVPDNGMVV